MSPALQRRRSPGLDATLIDRFTTRPAWARTILLRRIAAGGLAVLAVILFVRDAADDRAVSVVVASRDLAPGVELTVADIELREFAPSAVPDGAMTDMADAVSRTLAGPVRSGEQLTDLRVLSSHLAEASIGIPDARVVPIRLGDPGVTDLLRSGDAVDVLTVGEGDDEKAPRVLAQDAAVVLVSAESTQQRGGDRVVLVAMPPTDAVVVAGASLVSALTVTLR